MCCCPPLSDVQCETLYVGDGRFCTLDQDGDSYPATVLSVICEEGENTSYCRQDLCPDVPNTDPSSDIVCQGFSQSSGTYSYMNTLLTHFRHSYLAVIGTGYVMVSLCCMCRCI